MFSYQQTVLSTLGKISVDDILNFFFLLFFQENRFWLFMQIVSSGDNLCKMSEPIFWEKYEKI